MQYITLDTNAWINLANGTEPARMLEAISSGVYSGDIVIILPSIIIDEWNRGKHKMMSGGMTKAFDEIEKNLGTVLKSLGSNYKHAALEIVGVEEDNKEVWKFFRDIKIKFQEGRQKLEVIIENNVATIESLFSHYSTRVIAPTNSIALKAGKFALEKKAPFSTKNSFADALILFTFIDYVEKNYIINARFITYNVDDFCEKRGGKYTLHTDLAKEFERSNSIFYHLITEAVNQVFNEIEMDFIEMMDMIQRLREQPDEEQNEEFIYEEDELCQKCSNKISFYKVELDDRRSTSIPGQLSLEFPGYISSNKLSKPISSILAGLCTNCQTEHFECVGCGEINIIEDDEYNKRKECDAWECRIPYFINSEHGDWHEDTEAYTNGYSILPDKIICQECGAAFWNNGANEKFCENCQSEYNYSAEAIIAT